MNAKHIKFQKTFTNEKSTQTNNAFKALTRFINHGISHIQKSNNYKQPRFHLSNNFDYSNIDISDIGQHHSAAEAFNDSLSAFEGLINPHHPGALFNIVPTPLNGTVALSMLTQLYNPNALLDITAGKFIYLERKIIKYLSQLIGWKNTKSSGFFTFGGKATLMYAVKAGLNNIQNDIINKGIKDEFIVLCSQENHYCLESICNFLGIGANNCIRIPTNKNGTINLTLLEKAISSNLQHNKKIAAVVLNGGTTINMVVDPIHKVKSILLRQQKKHKLNYAIHLHLDTVISWAWLFFLKQTIESLPTSATIQSKLTNIKANLKHAHLADSFGVDFHKTGLCPYISSCFVAKSEDKITTMHIEPENCITSHSRNDQCLNNTSFENSRPCTGIISAYYAIKRLGADGFTSYIIYLHEASQHFISLMQNQYKELFEVVNTKSNGYEIVFFIKFNKLFSSYKKILRMHKKTNGHTNNYAWISLTSCLMTHGFRKSTHLL